MRKSSPRNFVVGGSATLQTDKAASRRVRLISSVIVGSLAVGAACATVAACASAESPGAVVPVPQATTSSPASDGGTPAADAPVEPAAPPMPPSGERMGASLDRQGATLTGTVTFRMWAATATSVSVVLGAAKLPMTSAGDGVFTVTTAEANVGDTYHYEITSSAGTFTRQDPYARESIGGASRIVDPWSYAWKTRSFTRPTRETLVLYELHVGSFAPLQGTTRGTFEGARARLPSLASLGVNGIEYLPLHDFGGTATSWGYSPQSYFAPKPSYGTASELRALVDAAHASGIGNYLDVVYNHYDSWSRAPLRCFDGLCAGNSAGAFFFPEGPWASTPWGPRPNYADKHVASFLLDSVDEWLTEYKGDGFRWDSVSNVRANDGQGTAPMGKELLVKANDWTHTKGGLSIAEDYKGETAITQRTADSGFGFDSQWDGFGYVLTDVLTPTDDNARDVGRIEGAVNGNYLGDPFARTLWIENHDTVGNGGKRFSERCDSADGGSYAAKKRTMLAATLLLTTPGVPMLFQGQEMLARGTFGDPPTPLDWSLETKERKFLAFYKDAIALRRNLDGVSAALASKDVATLHREDRNKVYAFRRGSDPKDDVVVVVNMRNRAYTSYDIGVRSGGTWNVQLDTDLQRYSDDFGQSQASAPLTARTATKDGQPYTVSVRLCPWSAVVLSKR